jgi:hypothetical protein
MKAARDLVRTMTVELNAIETLIDEAYARMGRLDATAVEGRRAANLPLFAGENGLAAMAQSKVDLLKARKSLHEAHYAFRDVREQMGAAPHAYGDFGDTPREVAPMGDARPSLQAVA